jgi:hypothetical protein
MIRAKIESILLFILIAIILFVLVKNFLVSRNKNHEGKKISQSDAVDKEINLTIENDIFKSFIEEMRHHSRREMDDLWGKVRATPEYQAFKDVETVSYCLDRLCLIGSFQFKQTMDAPLEKLKVTPEWQAYDDVRKEWYTYDDTKKLEQFDQFNVLWEKVKATPEFKACLSCLSCLEFR